MEVTTLGGAHHVDKLARGTGVTVIDFLGWRGDNDR